MPPKNEKAYPDFTPDQVETIRGVLQHFPTLEAKALDELETANYDAWLAYNRASKSKALLEAIVLLREMAKIPALDAREQTRRQEEWYKLTQVLSYMPWLTRVEPARLAAGEIDPTTYIAFFTNLIWEINHAMDTMELFLMESEAEAYPEEVFTAAVLIQTLSNAGIAELYAFYQGRNDLGFPDTEV